MRKQEFLDTLRKNLKVLRQDEINDILEEYAGYIESMMEEGKSEEEAVRSFGDPTALAKEILSAYKVSDDYLNHTKAGEFMDKGSHLFARAVNYLSAWFRSLSGRIHFVGNPGSVLEFLMAVLVGLVIIALMRIPFFLVEGIGQIVVDLLVGGGYLSRLLGGLWELFVNICFLVAAVLVVISMVRGGLGDKFRHIMVVHGWMKPNSSRAASRQAPAREPASAPEEDASSFQETAFDGDAQSPQEEENPLYEEAQEAQEEAFAAESTAWETTDGFRSEPASSHVQADPAPHARAQAARQDHGAINTLGGCLASFFFGCLKLAGLVCITLPLLLFALVGAFLTGSLIAVMGQGVTLVGPFLCALGGTVACGLLTAMSVCLFLRRGKGVAPQVIPLVVSIMVCGFGLVFSFFEIAGYDFVEVPQPINATQSYTIPVSDRVTSIYAPANIASVQLDDSLPEGTLRLEIDYNDRLSDSPQVYQETSSYLTDSAYQEWEAQWNQLVEEYEEAYARYEAALYDEEGNEVEGLEPPEYPDEDSFYKAFLQTHQLQRDELRIYTGDAQWDRLDELWDYYLEGLRNKELYNPDNLLSGSTTVYLSEDLAQRLYSRDNWQVVLDSADHRLLAESAGYQTSQGLLTPDGTTAPAGSDELYPSYAGTAEESTVSNEGAASSEAASSEASASEAGGAGERTQEEPAGIPPVDAPASSSASSLAA